MNRALAVAILTAFLVVFFITGSLDYTPPPKKGFPVTLVIVLATLIGAGMVGLFALRRVILRSLGD